MLNIDTNLDIYLIKLLSTFVLTAVCHKFGYVVVVFIICFLVVPPLFSCTVIYSC